MTSATDHPTRTPSLRWLTPAAIILALGGIGLGLTLARLLYEADPLRWSAFGGWLPSLALAAMGAGLLAGLMRVPALRSSPAPAFLPLLLVWLYVISPADQVLPVRGLILLLGALALTTLFLLKKQGDRPVLIAVVAIMLLAYLLTLQRTVGRADTFEFQVTAPVLGVAHPTGYPLFILLGKVFSLLPLGSTATRVNLTSLAAAVTTSALIVIVLSRILRIDTRIAGLAALTFGLSRVFWGQAVVAEVYALHNLLAMTLLGGALALIQRENSPIPTARLVPAIFLIAGLSLTHHLTTVLIFPALILAFLFARPRLSWRIWAVSIALFAAALLIYLYIPLRWPALNEGRTMPFNEFIDWITGSRFSGALQLRAWLTDPDRWRIVGRLLLDQYGWPGLILSIVGVIALLHRDWRAALITGGMFAAYGFYGLNYLVPDIDVFLIPMFLIGALWMAFGLHTLIQFARTRFDSSSAWIEAAALTLFALLPLSLAWTNGPGFDWSDEQELEAWGRDVLALPLEQGAAILADSEKIAPLEYLHRIEGLRPDMDMVVLGTEDDYRSYLFAALAEGRPIYLQRYLPGLEGTYYLRSVGPLIEVGTEPITNASGDQLAAWENGIQLEAISFDARAIPEGQTSGITLYWRAVDPVNDNTQIRLRLIDSDGEIVWQSAPVYAVNNRYPPVAWKPAEVVIDRHDLSIPYGISPGLYRLEVSLSAPFSESFIQLDSGDIWADIASLTVSDSASQPAIDGLSRTAMSGSGQALIGINLPPRAPAGRPVPYQLVYRSTDGISVTAGELDIEGGSSAGPLTYDSSTEEVILVGDNLRCGWLRPISDACVVAHLRIEGQAVSQAVANFDNEILLTSVDFESGRIEPGQTLDVTLHWQALRTINEDYTIFVHILGPDGLLHGQVDQWPVQGTFPTSAWTPGEIIDDAYRVPVDPDAPPGSYQLEIGIYLLSTNTRLLILDEAGSVVGDHILLDGLIIAPSD